MNVFSRKEIILGKYSGSCRHRHTRNTIRRNWWEWLTDGLTDCLDCWYDSDPHHLMNPVKHAPRLAHCFPELPAVRANQVHCLASQAGGRRKTKNMTRLYLVFTSPTVASSSRNSSSGSNSSDTHSTPSPFIPLAIALTNTLTPSQLLLCWEALKC